MTHAVAAGGTTLCAGSAHWDVIGRAALSLARGDDVPGHVEHRPGGVALNVATGLARRAHAVGLCAMVGTSRAARALVEHIASLGIDTAALLTVPGDGPGGYMAIEDEDGELVAAIAGVRAIEDHGMALAERAAASLGAAQHLFVETNLPSSAIAAMADAAEARGTSIVGTAVNPATADRLRVLLGHTLEATIIANLAEANRLLATEHHGAEPAAAALVRAGAGTALVTHGASDAAIATPAGSAVRTPKPVPRRTVTGAGDALIAGYLVYASMDDDPVAALDAGLAAAAAHISAGGAP